jgi:hypothetical protein
MPKIAQHPPKVKLASIAHGPMPDKEAHQRLEAEVVRSIAGIELLVELLDVYADGSGAFTPDRVARGAAVLFEAFELRLQSALRDASEVAP